VVPHWSDRPLAASHATASS